MYIQPDMTWSSSHNDRTRSPEQKHIYQAHDQSHLLQPPRGVACMRIVETTMGNLGRLLIVAIESSKRVDGSGVMGSWDTWALGTDAGNLEERLKVVWAQRVDQTINQYTDIRRHLLCEDYMGARPRSLSAHPKL